MFLPAGAIGVICALASAVIWGGGDFSGGVATRRSGPFQVLAIAALSGIAMLLLFAVLTREALPAAASVRWALLAGVAGAVGIAALYRGLSLGNAALVAPTSGVLGAAVPVVFGVVTGGAPAPARLAGFALALLGIWLVSRPAAHGDVGSQRGFLLACLAGVSFGAFFILIAQVQAGSVFTPLILARGVQFAVALLMLRAYRLAFPALAGNPTALLAGVLDAAGNVFYVLARQFVPLEVAAVLASFYPASTVILAGIILKERVSASQGIGVAACLSAIVLITL